MSDTEASHTQIPSRRVRAWKKKDLPVAMADREVWWQVVDSIPAPRAAR